MNLNELVISFALAKKLHGRNGIQNSLFVYEPRTDDDGSIYHIIKMRSYDRRTFNYRIKKQEDNRVCAYTASEILHILLPAILVIGLAGGIYKLIIMKDDYNSWRAGYMLDGIWKYKCHHENLAECLGLLFLDMGELVNDAY